MCGLMVEALETQTMPIALIVPHNQEIRITQNLQGAVATIFSIKALKRRLSLWVANVVCPANLAGHVTIRNLIG